MNIRSDLPPDLTGPCFNCLSEEHVVAMCTNERVCLRCRRPGHIARECRNPRSRSPPAANPRHVRERIGTRVEPSPPPLRPRPPSVHFRLPSSGACWLMLAWALQWSPLVGCPRSTAARLLGTDGRRSVGYRRTLAWALQWSPLEGALGVAVGRDAGDWRVQQKGAAGIAIGQACYRALCHPAHPGGGGSGGCLAVEFGCDGHGWPAVGFPKCGGGGGGDGCAGGCGFFLGASFLAGGLSSGFWLPAGT
ncbi:hypothetical protein VPH35_019815 [Triticum aestivum]